MRYFAFFGLVLFFCAATAHAAVFGVNSNSDTNDAFIGDGVCGDAAGNCTLRAAGQEANALTGADTVNFQSSGTTAVTLSLGEILITDSITINGTDANATSISGAGVSRIFNIQRTGITVNIKNLSVLNGRAVNSGGCINVGSGNLTVETVNVRGCFAETGGGGINSQNGVLRILNSTVENNIVGAGGAVGGGIAYYGSDSEIRRSRIIGNDAPRGGGIAVSGGVAKIIETTVSGNTTAIGGGGLLASFGAAQVTASTIANNTAQRSGGGIALPMGTVILTNSTVSGNRVLNGEGGGISTGTNGSVGYLTVRNSTIVNNQALYAGGLTGGSATATVVGNSIVANNTAATAPNIAAVFTSLGGNLVNNRAGGEGYVDTDLPDGTDPLIGALADNGGATQTHALLTGSQAINAGLNALAIDADGNALVNDQRGAGFPRIIGTAVDVGSFEFTATAVTTVSGRVVAGGRNAASASGAQVILTNLVSGERRIALTNQAGHFRFLGVPENQMHRVEISHKRFVFEAQTLMIDGKNNELTFIAR